MDFFLDCCLEGLLELILYAIFVLPFKLPYNFYSKHISKQWVCIVLAGVTGIAVIGIMVGIVLMILKLCGVF